MRVVWCRSIVVALVGFLLIAASPTASTLRAADSPKDTFIRSWKGSRVVVKQALYTLLYTERGLTGNMSGARRDGLNVVTPFDGVYFQFDGRRSQEDIIERDPRRVQSAIATKYLKTAVLDIGTYPTIEAISLERYEIGFELVVSDIRIDRDTVRLMFRDPVSETKAETATTLTVKWPMPLSKSFTERSAIENLIRGFVEVQSAKH